MVHETWPKRAAIIRNLKASRKEAEEGDDSQVLDLLAGSDSDDSVQFVSFFSRASTKQLKRGRDAPEEAPEGGECAEPPPARTLPQRWHAFTEVAAKLARTEATEAVGRLFGSDSPLAPISAASSGIKARLEAIRAKRRASEAGNAIALQAVKAAREPPKPSAPPAAAGGDEAAAPEGGKAKKDMLVLLVGWRSADGDSSVWKDMVALAPLQKPLRRLWKRMVKASGGDKSLGGCKLTFNGLSVKKDSTLESLDATLVDEAVLHSERDASAAEAECWVEVHVGVPSTG